MLSRIKLFCRRILGGLRRTIKFHIPRAFLTRRIPTETNRLVVVLTPGYELLTGGVMAITVMYQESKAMPELHRAQVALCTIPGDAPLLKYAWFKNSNYILDLESVLKRCGQLDYLLLHIPEYRVNRVRDWLAASTALLQNVREIHLNVLLFNIDLIQDQDVKGLEKFGVTTITTAHEAYSNLAQREALGVPLHRLLISKGPEYYTPVAYHDKEQLLIVSPDPHPFKEKVLRQIAQALPNLKIQIVENLSYEEYTKLIRRARWALTFGEGLDGYFAETIFSGGVSFAVFNERFFTSGFADLETVYPSWEVLMDRIVSDIRCLDEPAAYSRSWQRAFDLLSVHLDTNRFRDNLRAFYRAEYTFP
jgi:hypothetical protein